MNACPDRRLLASYEGGACTDAQAVQMELHLRSCPSCRAALQDLRARDPDGQLARKALKAVVSPLTDEHGRNSNPWPIPDYERIVLCGEGAYGSVWAVRDRVGVHRALKMIDLQRLGRQRAAQRELRALETYCRKISRHPYLITIQHVGLADNILYYTMELADDRKTPGVIRDVLPPNYHAFTLETIAKGRRLHVDLALELARRILRGLSMLHGLDLVHRDIKPSNVIFVNRQPKLADIGLVSSEGDSLSIIGTPRYMPPDRQMDKTADTFAMGTMLRELIAGCDAAGSSTPHVDPLESDSLWSSDKWDRDRLHELLCRACAEKAAHRFPSAAAMLEELEACAVLEFDLLADKPWPLPVSRADRNQPRSETALVAMACLRTIPWILGFIAVMAALSKLLR